MFPFNRRCSFCLRYIFWKCSFSIARLKGTDLPPLFMYEIPTWDPHERKQVLTLHPFLLPHEMVHYLVSKDPDLLHVCSINYPQTRELLESTCGTEGLRVGRTAALGIHGDGVPYTKKDSVEILSFNFLSEPTADRTLT